METVDAAGHSTRFVYDALGRQIETIYADETPDDDSDNPRTRMEYNAVHLVTARIDELGNRTEFAYDENGRRTVSIDPQGNRTQTDYDAAGRVVAVTNALGRTLRHHYDSRGFPVGLTFPDGTSVTYTLDGSGRITSMTNQAELPTLYEYDGLGRLIAVIDALGHRTQYAYDELGNLVTQTDANGHATRFEYDRLGRTTSVILPMGQQSATAYDAVGNIVSTTDFNGNTVTFEYDSRNRLTSKHFPDGASVEVTYTPTGLRDQVVDARGITEHDYDARHRLVSRTEPDGRTINYEYDAAGNVLVLRTPSGAVSYTYDALHRLDSVSDPALGLTRYTYDAIGNLEQTEFPNGTVEFREYNEANRLIRLEHTGPEGIIASFHYELDALGNRTAIKEHDGRRVEYLYDEVFRLTEEWMFEPLGEQRRIEYTYDPVGNRLSRNDSAEGLTTYLYDANDRLITEMHGEQETRYTYDANGNMLSREAAVDRVFNEWDFENRLIGVDTNGDGTVDVQYQHDADGMRVAKTVDAEETRFLLDKNRAHAEVIEEYTPGGIILASYVHGNSLISQERAGERSFYHADGLGSTRALTDGNATVTDRYVYDAFGQVIGQIGTTGNLYLFAGEQFDPHAGMLYLRARYLDLGTGRFASQDPFPGRLHDSMSLHRYLYAHGNPVNNIDPSGEFSLLSVLSALNIQNILRGTHTFRVTQTFCNLIQAIDRVKLAITLARAAMTIAVIPSASSMGGFNTTTQYEIPFPPLSSPKDTDLKKIVYEIGTDGKYKNEFVYRSGDKFFIEVDFNKRTVKVAGQVKLGDNVSVGVGTGGTNIQFSEKLLRVSACGVKDVLVLTGKGKASSSAQQPLKVELNAELAAYGFAALEYTLWELP